MGQYWLLVNVTKGEYVTPWGWKLLEIAWNPDTVWILTGLLADGKSNGLGGGDLDTHPEVGRWSGDQVLFAGDYGPQGLYVDTVAKNLGLTLTEDDGNENLWTYIQRVGLDISDQVANMVSAIRRD